MDSFTVWLGFTQLDMKPFFTGPKSKCESILDFMAKGKPPGAMMVIGKTGSPCPMPKEIQDLIG